jgi:hypothetical protein
LAFLPVERQVAITLSLDEQIGRVETARDGAIELGFVDHAEAASPSM